MCRHFLARTAIDDQRLGTHALGGARHVDGRVAATVNDDPPAQHGLVFTFHAAQQRNGVDDSCGVTGRNPRPFADVCTDRQESGVKLAGLHGVEDIVDLAVQSHRDPKFHDTLHLGLEYIARQAVLGNAEAHHAAQQRARLMDRDAVTEPAQVVGRRHARGAGADDQDMLAGFGGRCRQLPAALERFITEKAFDRIDADGCIDLAAVADVLATVVADASHDCREGVILGQVAPGAFIIAGFGMEQPALDVLTGRALIVAGRQAVNIHRSRRAPRAGPVGQRRAGV